MNLSSIKFDEKGLIPAIVQDARTKKVLTLAYMNEESLKKTLEIGETVFYSRSRQELWHKGETSGNTQKVIDIHVDCDQDALVVFVNRRDLPAILVPRAVLELELPIRLRQKRAGKPLMETLFLVKKTAKENRRIF